MDKNQPMPEEQSKFRKFLFNEVSLALSIAAAVFFIMNYVNSPINKIELQQALMQKDIANISEQHSIYGKNAADRDDKIIEMDKKITQILQILEDKK